MKRLLAVAMVAALAAAVAIPALAATKTVKIGDDFFKPTKVTVKAGTKVTWKWTGTDPHNVTVVKGPKKFHSRTQSKGTFSAIPHTKGTYKIVCTIHAGMAMTLKVR